jgi:hypothetical protein
MSTGGIATAEKVSASPGIITHTYEFRDFDTLSLPEKFTRGELELVEGVWRLTYSLDSVNPDTVGRAFRIRGATSCEPLATHKLFEDISDDEWVKWRKWELDPNDQTLEGWKPNASGVSARMTLYYQKRLRGMTDYYAPTVEIEVIEKGADNVNLARLGKIDSPPIGVSLPDSRNWLLIAVNGDCPGDSSDYVSTRVWRASGPGGWDSDIYGNS